MKKILIVFVLIIIGFGIYIYFSFFNKTIPIYKCNYIGSDGKEYTSTYIGKKMKDSTCTIKRKYKCKYAVCDTEKDGIKTAIIYDGNIIKKQGGYYIINSEGTKLVGPSYEIKVIKDHYLVKESENSKYSLYKESNNSIILVEQDIFDNAFSIDTDDNGSYTYIGVVNGKYGFIYKNDDNKYIYDFIKPANYHNIGFECAILKNGEKQNIAIIQNNFEPIFNEWYDFVQLLYVDDTLYLLYVDQTKLNVGTYNIDTKEFNLVTAFDIKYNNHVFFYNYNNMINIETDVASYLYNPITNQIN